MSFEKVKINSIETIHSRKTGEVHHFLRVDVLKTYDIYLNDKALLLKDHYLNLRGKEVLLPLESALYNGNPTFNLVDDGMPIPIPTSSATKPAFPVDSQDADLNKAADKKPMFGSK